MTDTTTESPQEVVDEGDGGRSFGDIFRSTEIDTRLLGMLAALAVIWIGFQIWSGGTFLTSRNLWNLSVQSSSVAIMATGMVLIIVSRNIDLSVGSMLSLVGMVMALVQVEILPDWIGFDHPMTWVIALAIGIALGALLGAFQGFIVAYVGVPAFIVTLGGLLVWRGVAWMLASGRTIAPMDRTYQLLGGGSRGAIGGAWSWVVAIVASIGIVALLVYNRRNRQKYGFSLRPLWADIALGTLGVVVVLGSVNHLNGYPLPGSDVARGLANPVLILIIVALTMNFIATRRPFGRYVYAIGGNPEAAELGGINTRWIIVKTFMMMGILVAIAAAVQTARLNAAVSGMGTLSELYVIAAAVIGGTSLSGGIGTIPGAVLGAVVMQSLQSGMVLVGIESALQDVVVGVVLVAAVAIDTLYRKRAT